MDANRQSSERTAEDHESETLSEAPCLLRGRSGRSSTPSPLQQAFGFEGGKEDQRSQEQLSA